MGWTDPDCRRTFPWGSEDEKLVELHRELARIRTEHPCLRYGSFAPLGGGRGWIAYGRFSQDGDCVAVACNNLDEAQVVKLRLRTLGITDECVIASRLCTASCNSNEHADEVGQVREGVLTVRVPAKSAIVLCPRTQQR